MAAATVTFHSIDLEVENSVSFESSRQHIVSRIAFTITVGRASHSMTVEVRQPWGSDMEVRTAEIAPPIGSYDGPLDIVALNALIERYYEEQMTDYDAQESWSARLDVPEVDVPGAV